MMAVSQFASQTTGNSISNSNSKQKFTSSSHILSAYHRYGISACSTLFKDHANPARTTATSGCASELGKYTKLERGSETSESGRLQNGRPAV